MAQTNPTEPGTRLIVSLHDKVVGTIERRGEGSSFRFDQETLDDPDRAVLGQDFEDDLGAAYSTGQGVPSWFANLLPEGPLRQLIAERAGVKEERAYFLLAVTGMDLPGAVRVRPESESPPDPDATPLSPSSTPDEEPLKFSLAGVQLKFSAMRDDRGLTIPAQGRGGNWIVKLPDQRYEAVPENEFTMLSWAREAGIDVPRIELVDVASIKGLPEQFEEMGGKALAIARFDRGPAESRIHIEDFAQVLGVGPGRKYGSANYETLARIIGEVSGEADLDEFVRRLVFAIVTGNGDAHLKNWSLIYPDGRNARLAPAYDLLSTVVYTPKDRLGLKLAGSKDYSTLTIERFKRFADKAQLDVERVTQIVEEFADRALDAWYVNSAEWPLPESLRQDLQRRIESDALRLA